MKKLFTYAFMMMVSMMAMTTLTSCEDDDQYEANLLTKGDWQGYLGEFYSDRWGLTGNTYETVIRFNGRGEGSTSGRGYEVDYDTRSPFRDYAYCEFRWSIVEGEIMIIYDDAAWNPVYIYDYHLSAKRFYGYMDDGTRRSIKFDFDNVNFDEWVHYENGDYWDDTYNEGPRRSRTANADNDNDKEAVPFIYNGKSVRSGVFAK
jgi:hypothetical protein